MSGAAQPASSQSSSFTFQAVADPKTVKRDLFNKAKSVDDLATGKMRQPPSTPAGTPTHKSAFQVVKGKK